MFACFPGNEVPFIIDCFFSHLSIHYIKKEVGMQERRRIDRKHLAVYSRVFDRTSGLVLGYLGDLSPNGTMLISDDPIPEGEFFNLRFDLPDPPLFSVSHLDLKARSAWCSPDVDPAFYNIGFEFISVSQDEQLIIAEMIEAYQFNWNPPDYSAPPSAL
jgi:hypothetical protein